MNKRRISLLASGLAALSFCAVPVFAQASSTNSDQAAHFLNKITKVNKTQEALAGQVDSKAGDNLAVKTYADTVNWDDKANQAAVDKIASEQNIDLNSNSKIPKTNESLMAKSGQEFAKAYVDAEVRDQTKALDAYKQAEQQFPDNQALQMYIKESIPMVESHVKTAKLLQQHMQEQTASK